ncbi:glycosyltransferase family 4 protein [Mucilaginibacter calamicampi]|uniref:Glycosyltransferase family 4 protein n=1 Tax=Mucilaginibacter calamicampi TaxID=1302352 RepID=A0ABW2YZC0_9SPHI
MSKIVLSHPTGNQFVRALLVELQARELLTRFYTTIATNPGSPWLGMLPAKFKQELLRRSYPVPRDIIETQPLKELSRNLLPKLGFKSIARHEVGWASVDAVYNELDNKVANALSQLKIKKGVTGIYAYEDGAAASFVMAKSLGLSCFYDLPIGYWRAAQQLLAAEAERWPDWAATLPGMHDSAEKLLRKDRELQLADKIFVASRFTAKTLEFYNGTLAPVEVIPYGFPQVAGREYNKISRSHPLKLLFVGGLSQRKGIADVFKTAEFFGNRVELTVVGHKTGNNCPVLNEALARHTWIPGLPHQQILKLMHQHDVLLFPSLFEGFGMVITEAMAQGTPVITTDRTAGPDIIEDGHNGWLIEAGNTEKLIEATERLLMKPELIEENGKAAIETAVKRPWQLYAKQLVASIIDEN